MRNHPTEERNQAIFVDVMSGKTFSTIAQKYNVSYSRIRQIHAKQGKLVLKRFVESVHGPKTIEREIPEYVLRLFEINVEHIEFSNRVHNCFLQAGIKTLGDLCGWSAKDLLMINNFGKRCLHEVEGALVRLGLGLRK